MRCTGTLEEPGEQQACRAQTYRNRLVVVVKYELPPSDLPVSSCEAWDVQRHASPRRRPHWPPCVPFRHDWPLSYSAMSSESFRREGDPLIFVFSP